MLWQGRQGTPVSAPDTPSPYLAKVSSSPEMGFGRRLRGVLRSLLSDRLGPYRNRTILRQGKALLELHLQPSNLRPEAQEPCHYWLSTTCPKLLQIHTCFLQRAGDGKELGRFGLIHLLLHQGMGTLDLGLCLIDLA